jgi:hypothetical protein
VDTTAYTAGFLPLNCIVSSAELVEMELCSAVSASAPAASVTAPMDSIDCSAPILPRHISQPNLLFLLHSPQLVHCLSRARFEISVEKCRVPW